MLASCTLETLRKCESETKLQRRSSISQSCLLRLSKKKRVPIGNIQSPIFTTVRIFFNKRLNPFKMHKFASLCKLQDRLQVITNETNPIGQIRKRNSLRNQIHFEFLQLKNSRTYSRKKKRRRTITPLDFPFRQINSRRRRKIEARNEIVPPASLSRNERSSAFQTRIENTKLSPDCGPIRRE